MVERGDDDATNNQPVTVHMEIADEQTKIRVTGDRDTALVVQSASGETIYLPPEDFDRPASAASPYDAGGGTQATPYASSPSADATTGVTPTADGYLVVHPEPVTDLRFLR